MAQDTEALVNVVSHAGGHVFLFMIFLCNTTSMGEVERNTETVRCRSLGSSVETKQQAMDTLDETTDDPLIVFVFYGVLSQNTWDAGRTHRFCLHRSNIPRAW